MHLIPVCGASLGVGLFSVAYLAAALVALLRWQQQRPAGALHHPAVSVLKPLCGAEPELYENLRSFCDQRYPLFEVIFGVRSRSDAAVAVVERLQAEFPHRQLVLVVAERSVGINHKVSNLTHIAAQAQYDYLVVSDSDIRVGADYLSAVVSPLADAQTGAVTCLYRGRPVGMPWSNFGALFIEGWFLPSVLLARTFGFGSFCLGASVALRRNVLEQIGGFQALASQLADDYVLGQRISATGLRVLLSRYVVETSVHEPSFSALLRHELRWARTVRTVQPLGHAFSFLSYGIPLSCLAAAALWPSLWALVLPGLAFALRTTIYLCVNRDRLPQALTQVPLLPVRGLLSLLIWVASYGSRRVDWRERKLYIERGGEISQRAERPPWIGRGGHASERELRS
jgi:ceramide glucosyltransferase